MQPETDNTTHIVNQLKKIRQKQIHLLKWYPQKNKWDNWLQGSKFNDNDLVKNKQLRTLTFNVLLDNFKDKDYKENMLCSEQRYKYIIDKVSEMGLEVLGFNQVTKTFYDILMEQEWVKNKYWVSKLNTQRGFGNIIMTKCQPIFTDTIKIPTLPRQAKAIFIPIKINDNIKVFCFCSVHLISLTTNAKKRQFQLNYLNQYMKKYQKSISGVVYQGDMNFHKQQENYIYLANDLRDCWVQKYDVKNRPGYTFDSSVNCLINQMYWGFERRRMRLDRILYSGNLISTKNIQVVFNEPIYKNQVKDGKVNHHWFGKGSFLFINDFFGWKMGRQNKEKYLFPSDHFGLLAELHFGNSSKNL